MSVVGYKPQCEASKRGTFYYSDFKFPCKKEEVVTEEDFEVVEDSVEDSDISEYDGEDNFDICDALRTEKEQAEENLQKKTKNKYECVPLSHEKPSCYSPTPHNLDDDFLARWKEKEKENFGRSSVKCPKQVPKPQESYEELLIKEPTPPHPTPSTPSPPPSITFLNSCTSYYRSLTSATATAAATRGRIRAHLKGTFTHEEIPTIPCLFCDRTLYENGFVHDLHDKIRKIQQESLLKNDEIAKKIGIRTRITVHKLCYEEYIKRPLIEPQEEKFTIYS